MPLVHSENIAEVGRLLVWQLVETEEVLRKMLPSSADFEELSSISHPQKKREWMAGRIVLAQIVAEAGEVFKGTWKDEHGKPFLIDCPYPISLTHTHDYVAAVIHPTLSVGIDMEQKNDKLIRTARKYLNESELFEAKNSLSKLCMYWCGKEALYKLNGRNNVSFKDNIFVEIFNENSNLLQGTWRDSGREVRASLQVRWFGTYCLIVAV
ncbi:4'-phosphopantetheinyl transferase family protein [Salmonirosea aquatica]|uniref:4'-phosphopantetheinyl transferase superfamily protein n=1 Tax=Salmonirosea aquatica TaxID=2654236 RepID=A0A7C9BEX3_9BACT|nr:4'-phosphopantetheinyl transferase superfamily protein [Cytophagaceae bacterium SJW1-29]